MVLVTKTVCVRSEALRSRALRRVGLQVRAVAAKWRPAAGRLCAGAEAGPRVAAGPGLLERDLRRGHWARPASGPTVAGAQGRCPL